MSPIPVLCYGCGYQASINKATAGLRCACGSTDLDVYSGSEEQIAHIAKLARAMPVKPGEDLGVRPPTFKEHMLSKGAGSEQLRGWSEYEGPMPGPNQMSNHVKQPIPCPTCLGSKVDIKDDGGPCRACGGKGVLTPTTSVEPEPAVYKHQYPSTQTTVPFMGRRKKQGGRRSADPLGSVEDHIKATTPGYGTQAPAKAAERSPAFGYRDERDYSKPGAPHVMPGTACPGCGSGPLGLKMDHRENAWMSCPTCGPLADIDANPAIDPYNLGEGFAPTRGYKAAKKVFAGKKTGRLIGMLTVIAGANPGLSQREVLHLARTSLRKYPESR